MAASHETTTLRRLRRITADVSGLAENDPQRWMPSMGRRGRPTAKLAAERARLAGLGYVKRPVNASQRLAAAKGKKARKAA